MSDLANDAYGHTVSVTTDGVSDFYLVGGAQTFSFPTGTPENTAYLAFTKTLKFQYFMADLRVFGPSQYDQQTQMNFLSLYLAAQAAGTFPNRMAYIAQLLNWLNSMSAYAAAFVLSIQAMSDPAVVAATQWNFSTFSASNPAITLLGAVSINN